MKSLASSLTPPILAVLQGVFYLLTGLWPLLHLPSFEAVTGPKTDDWLVHTAGGLITAIGLALLVAGVRRNVGLELRLLGIGSALALTAIDFVYVFNGTISAIYLLDALAEIALFVGWVIAWQTERRRQPSSPSNHPA